MSSACCNSIHFISRCSRSSCSCSTSVSIACCALPLDSMSMSELEDARTYSVRRLIWSSFSLFTFFSSKIRWLRVSMCCSRTRTVSSSPIACSDTLRASSSASCSSSLVFLTALLSNVFFTACSVRAVSNLCTSSCRSIIVCCFSLNCASTSTIWHVRLLIIWSFDSLQAWSWTNAVIRCSASCLCSFTTSFLRLSSLFCMFCSCPHSSESVLVSASTTET
mmetsp:Transcript_11959/g.21719  ORF Transcript_11959/g.21719 Transcript_11959/m.21719 type:complete len:221 (+) Transcript_11959:627-1289(+)